MIKAALDYIPQTVSQFSNHFLNCFSYETPVNAFTNHKFTRISGYSCRSLFDTTLKYYVDKNPNLRILTTPIHHTSFRNIIEKYIKPENIFILEINDKYNTISDIPKEDGLNVLVDLCIITHLFGQDMDCQILQSYHEENPECIMIEDRVQGGEFDKTFSNDFMDMALYSTGMDKKPCGLGGGFLCINNPKCERPELFSYLLMKISNYPKESMYERLWFLTKKIPTFLLYNFRSFIGCILLIFWYLGIDLHNFSSKYRKTNPGFSHDGYNKNPNSGTLISISQSLQTYCDIENLYKKKTAKFYSLLTDRALSEMIPWVNNGYSLTSYNTLMVDNRDKFIDYLNIIKVPVIENPTYKIFNFEYEGSDKYKKFSDSLVYIPSLAIMTDKEIDYLASLINNYYCKNT